MRRKDLGITNKALFRSIVRQSKKGIARWFAHSIKPEEAEKVECFRFSKKEIESLKFFKFFPNVTELTLYNVKGLKSLEGMQYLTKLDDLRIYKTSLNDLTPLEACTQLVYFDYIPDSSGKLESSQFNFLRNLPLLAILDLSENNISDLQFLKNMPQLTQLVLSENPLKTLEGIELLQNLEYLELENCGLKNLDGVEQLHALKYLMVSGNFNINRKMEFLQRFHIEHFEL